MKDKDHNLQNVNEIPDINKRFLSIINENNLTGYALEKSNSGITSSKLTHIRKGRNKPTEDMIEALVKIIPNLNRVYILTGEGDRYIKSSDIKDSKSNSDNKTLFNTLSIEEKLYSLHIQNSKLIEENENLKDLVEDLSLKMEISLAPILRHFHLKKDGGKEGPSKAKSSIN